jgi:hypothetical protein
VFGKETEVENRACKVEFAPQSLRTDCEYKKKIFLSPSQWREAPCEGTNSPRLFTPGETKALAKSKAQNKVPTEGRLLDFSYDFPMILA